MQTIVIRSLATIISSFGVRKGCPGLTEVLSYLRSGDTLVVGKLDRLGRTVKGLVDLVIDLEDKGVNFKSITDVKDTTASAGRFFFHIMARPTRSFVRTC